MTDPLSETLALVDARCEVAGGFRAGGDWALRIVPDAPVKLEAVVRGACWLVARDAAPTRLGPGDAVVLRGAGPVVLCSDPGVAPVGPEALVRGGPGELAALGTGDEVAVVGGHVAVDPAAAGLLEAALPAVTRAVATSAEAEELRRLLEQVVAEHGSARPGAAFAVAHHGQLLLLAVLRVALRREALGGPSWLRLVADDALRPAVQALHDDPARAWSLAELAAAAAMSRSHFAHRFRARSGQTPMAYLAAWRVRLAERALRGSDVPLAALADRLGYASESSFSHAFARVTGTTPGRYRRAHRP